MMAGIVKSPRFDLQQLPEPGDATGSIVYTLSFSSGNQSVHGVQLAGEASNAFSIATTSSHDIVNQSKGNALNSSYTNVHDTQQGPTRPTADVRDIELFGSWVKRA
jgi:hypothetical protein